MESWKETNAECTHPPPITQYEPQPPLTVNAAKNSNPINYFLSLQVSSSSSNSMRLIFQIFETQVYGLVQSVKGNVDNRFKNSLLVYYNVLGYALCSHIDNNQLSTAKFSQWTTSKTTPYCKVHPLLVTLL